MSTTPLVIRNASVLDVDAGTYSTADVVSVDGKISSVGRDPRRLRVRGSSMAPASS